MRAETFCAGKMMFFQLVTPVFEEFLNEVNN